MLFLASDAVATLSIQWGNNLGAMIVIWVLGSAIIWRIRRFHICAIYVASFLLFSVVRAWITGDPWLSEVSPITGPEYQLFIFFMITDPKTTVRSKFGQCVVAFLVALVEMFFRLGSEHLCSALRAFHCRPDCARIRNVDELAAELRRGASTTIVAGKSCPAIVALLHPRNRFEIFLILISATAYCSSLRAASRPPVLPRARESLHRQRHLLRPNRQSRQIPLRRSARPSGPIRFTDITAQAGIHFKHNNGAFGQKYLPETMGSGVCVLDYDNDGWQDILLVNSMDWPGHASRQVVFRAIPQ